MTYANFIAGIKERVFPEGEPYNLTSNHDAYLLDGLIDLQRKVPCLQDRHWSLFDFASTYYRAGVTIIEPAPVGVIRAVYTYTSDGPPHGRTFATGRPASMAAIWSGVSSRSLKILGGTRAPAA